MQASATHRPVDFFVIGAQKSGTTSLCDMLGTLPGVCMAQPKEPLFFSRDEAELHPHFFLRHGEDWLAWDYTTRREELLARYHTHFSDAQPHSLLGDGSTSYLPSQRAPQRIAAYNPAAKIIAILRDPARRAYSAYWHYLRQGLAAASFTDHLAFEHGMTLRMGDYATHTARWMEYFPRTQCLFLLYEELVAQPQHVMQAVCDFLHLPCPSHVTLASSNSGGTPRSLTLQCSLNRWRRSLCPVQSAMRDIQHSTPTAWLFDTLSTLNHRRTPPPPMPADLHHRLDMHYLRTNESLPTLTGLNVTHRWYTTLQS